MSECDEQTLPLTIFSNPPKKDNTNQTIRRIGPYGNMVLNVANYYGRKEVIQLLLTSNAVRSFEKISYRMNEIKELFERNTNLFYSSEDIQDIDYIEWPALGEILFKKRQEFRSQIDLYKIYNNQHHLITKLLIEIIDYYLKISDDIM